MTTRKPLPSMLDPFREKLLQMDKDKITRTKMLAWLRARQMPCSRSNLRYFLTTRRAEHNRNQMPECIAPGAGQCQSVEKFFAGNPAPEI